MPNGITLEDLRLSLVWVEATDAFLEQPPPAGAPFGFLAGASTYERVFDESQHGRPTPAGLEPPWSREGKQLFWVRYLESRPLDTVRGHQAWKALVPLRARLPIAVVAPWLPGVVSFEAFFYPFAVALVVTAICRTSLSLDAALDLAYEIRRTGGFELNGQDGTRLKLDALAGRAFAMARTMALGPGAPPGIRTVDPFTVATVVRGAGVDPTVPVPEGGEVHRALEALTAWPPDRLYARLPSLAASSLETRSTDAVGDLLYARRRGRAIWFPASFARRDRRLHALACYHRNLLFASLQVESLGTFVVAASRRLEARLPFSPLQDDCARRAAGALGRLYGGDRHTTYRSRSPRAHIDQNDLVTPLNGVRKLYGMAPLA